MEHDSTLHFRDGAIPETPTNENALDTVARGKLSLTLIAAYIEPKVAFHSKRLDHPPDAASRPAFRFQWPPPFLGREENKLSWEVLNKLCQSLQFSVLGYNIRYIIAVLNDRSMYYRSLWRHD